MKRKAGAAKFVQKDSAASNGYVKYNRLLIFYFLKRFPILFSGLFNYASVLSELILNIAVPKVKKLPKMYSNMKLMDNNMKRRIMP